MVRSRQVPWILLVSVFAVIGAACSGATSTTAPTTGAGVSAPAVTKTLKVMDISALTGASAAYGNRTLHGAQVAVKQINDAGGFADNCGGRYVIDLPTFDMANSKEQAIAGLRQASDDSSILAVIGPPASVGYVAMIPAAGDLKMPMVSAGSAAFVDPASWNPYAFRVTVTVQAAQPRALKWLVDNAGLKKAAFIYDTANDTAVSEFKVFRDLAPTLGYEVVSVQSFKTGDTDFSPQLTAIKAAGLASRTPFLKQPGSSTR